MLTVAVPNDEFVWGERPYERMRRYDPALMRQVYGALFGMGLAKGIRFVQTNFDWYYNGKFSKGWFFDGEWRIITGFEADLVYDKTKFIEPYREVKRRFGLRILNPYDVEETCCDKIVTHERFPDLVPRTAKDPSELSSSLVVHKPNFGSGAAQIVVMNREAAIPVAGALYQEFVPCREDYPGSVYDTRVILANGKPVQAYRRVSPKGSLISNLSAGGRQEFLDNVPSELEAPIAQIDGRFANSPRLYTADFVIDPSGKPWLIELNSKPGLQSYAKFDRMDKLDEICEALISAIIEGTSKLL